MVILVALAMSACGTTSNRATAATPTPTVTPAPTPTLAPARPLAWQTQRLPFVPGLGGLAISHADGTTAYTCRVSASSPSVVEVWATHDRAAHWARMADVATDAPLESCAIVADDLLPATAVVRLCKPDTEEGTSCWVSSSDLTADGGATWTPVSGALPQFLQVATRGTLVYALTHRPPHSRCSDCSPSLAVSHDGMRTWTQLGMSTIQFWLNPATGALLVATSGAGTLSLTTDGGAHWTQSIDPNAGGFMGAVAQAPPPDLRWHACDFPVGFSSDHPTYPSMLDCTTDGGKTWVGAGGPYVPWSPGFIRSNLGYAYAFGIATDGSVLAHWILPGSAGHVELRRLPMGRSAWESLGPLPVSDREVTNTDTGALEYAPGAIRIAPANGGDTTAGNVVYTAAYP